MGRGERRQQLPVENGGPCRILCTNKLRETGSRFRRVRSRRMGDQRGLADCSRTVLQPECKECRESVETRLFSDGGVARCPFRLGEHRECRGKTVGLQLQRPKKQGDSVSPGKCGRRREKRGGSSESVMQVRCAEAEYCERRLLRSGRHRRGGKERPVCLYRFRRGSPVFPTHIVITLRLVKHGIGCPGGIEAGLKRIAKLHSSGGIVLQFGEINLPEPEGEPRPVLLRNHVPDKESKLFEARILVLCFERLNGPYALVGFATIIR